MNGRSGDSNIGQRADSNDGEDNDLTNSVGGIELAKLL